MTSLNRAMSNNFQIGLAELRLGGMTQAGKLTQANSVGMCKSISVNVQKQFTELKAGNTNSRIHQKMTGYDIEVNAELQEFTHKNLKLIFSNELEQATDSSVGESTKVTVETAFTVGTLSDDNYTLSAGASLYGAVTTKEGRWLRLIQPLTGNISYVRATPKKEVVITYPFNASAATNIATFSAKLAEIKTKIGDNSSTASFMYKQFLAGKNGTANVRQNWDDLMAACTIVATFAETQTKNQTEFLTTLRSRIVEFQTPLVGILTSGVGSSLSQHKKTLLGNEGFNTTTTQIAKLTGIDTAFTALLNAFDAIKAGITTLETPNLIANKIDVKFRSRSGFGASVDDVIEAEILPSRIPVYTSTNASGLVVANGIKSFVVPNGIPGIEYSIEEGTKDLIGVYSKTDPTKLMLLAVTSAKGVANGVEYTFNSDQVIETSAGEHFIYLANPISINASNDTTFFTVDIVHKVPGRNSMQGYRFWKVAIQSGLDFAYANEQYGSIPLKLVVFEPTEEDLEPGGELFHVRDQVRKSKFGTFWG